MLGPIRVLVAKPGLDGHDRGAKIIARALRDAGMEVIYTGLRQTPEMIVNAALQEDVQVVVGGIIPDEDARELERRGVAAVFQPGASLETVVSVVRQVAARADRP